MIIQIEVFFPRRNFREIGAILCKPFLMRIHKADYIADNTESARGSLGGGLPRAETRGRTSHYAGITVNFIF